MGIAMKVRAIEDADWAAYDEVAVRQGMLFDRRDWLSLFGDQMRAFGLFDEGGTLVGGFSLYRERRWGLKILRRAPFTPTCGPFLDVKSQHPVAVLEERRKALEGMIGQIEAEGAALCLLPLERNVSDALPFFWRGYKVVPNYTYVLDLSTPPEQMLKEMSSERRKNLSKAGRDGLRTAAAAHMEEVRDLVLATFRRQRKGVDQAGLEAILFRYATPSNSFAFTTYRGDRPIATCFVVHDATTAYYLLGGYSAEERHHGAGAAAMFEAIQRAREIGMKTFDFEGSVIPAIERYFRGFGGRLTPFFTVNKAWLPVEMGLKMFPGWRNRF